MPPADDAADLSTLSEDLGKRWSTTTESIRTRTDTTAKALAGLGTTGITAASLTKFSDIFPLPSTPSLAQGIAIGLVVAGLLAMVCGIAFFTVQLTHVSSPLFMRLSPDEMTDDGISTPERAKISEIYDDNAHLNDAPTLEIYAYRGMRLQRIAQRTTDPAVRKRAAAEAKQINADVTTTQARAATNVVRKRATEAVRGGKPLSCYLLFACGLLAFGFSTDYLDSERSSRVASAKSCAEAITAIRAADSTTQSPLPSKLLPSLCGGKAAVPKPATSAAATTQTVTSGAVKDLAVRYDACLASAHGDATRCSAIQAGINALLAP